MAEYRDGELYHNAAPGGQVDKALAGPRPAGSHRPDSPVPESLKNGLQRHGALTGSPSLEESEERRIWLAEGTFKC